MRRRKIVKQSVSSEEIKSLQSGVSTIDIPCKYCNKLCKAAGEAVSVICPMCTCKIVMKYEDGLLQEKEAELKHKVENPSKRGRKKKKNKPVKSQIDYSIMDMKCKK